MATIDLDDIDDGDLNECADCGASTAPGTPDPHTCGEDDLVTVQAAEPFTSGERIPPRPAVILTGETIDDYQIRALRDRVFMRIHNGTASKEDRETHAICESALNEMCYPPRRREARSRCAAIINATEES